MEQNENFLSYSELSEEDKEQYNEMKKIIVAHYSNPNHYETNELGCIIISPHKFEKKFYIGKKAYTLRRLMHMFMYPNTPLYNGLHVRVKCSEKYCIFPQHIKESKKSRKLEAREDAREYERQSLEIQKRNEEIMFGDKKDDILEEDEPFPENWRELVEEWKE